MYRSRRNGHIHRDNRRYRSGDRKDNDYVSGSSTVTFEYKNNVKEISLNDADKEVTVEAGTTGNEFTVNVTGELDEEGYDVTEPALKWTYSERGIAQVLRTGSEFTGKRMSDQRVATMRRIRTMEIIFRRRSIRSWVFQKVQ